MREREYSCLISLVSYKTPPKVGSITSEKSQAESLSGRGRGRQVVSVAKTADLVLLMSESIGRLAMGGLHEASLIPSRCHQICRAEKIVGD